MAFCSNCGKELDGGIKFCPVCGTPAEAAPAAEPVYTAPVYEAPKAEPVYTAPVYEAPKAAPSYNPNPVAEVENMVGEAFSSGLAATICAWFPVASIIAIGKGSKALKKREEAQKMAEAYGVTLPGKNIAARILGMVGKIGGIVMTVFWPLYIIILIAALA